MVERLGAGAFGEVYLAEQDSGAGFRRRVALKLLAAQVAHHGEAGRRMRDEARILGRLAHRNIVSVLDLVQLGPSWAVVMDYVPGADLDRVLEALERSDAYLSPTAALEVGAAVAEAIDHAFHIEDGGRPLGVLHRDIKPGNVLLTRDGEVKVLDFGVARMNLDTRESRTGVRVGTERYMSPQRLVGDDDGLAGDVYALAAMIAELLLRYPIGKTPVAPEKHAAFVQDASKNLRDMLAWHEAPTEPAAVLVALLEAALAQDPAARPPARAFADQLADLARSIPGESLVAFSRRFISTVDSVLGREREPVDGVLSEGSTLPSPASLAQRREDSATRPPEAFELDEEPPSRPLPPVIAPRPTPLPAAPRAAPRASNGWLVAGAVGALVCVGLVAIWTWPNATPAPAAPLAPPAPAVIGTVSVDPPVPPVLSAPVPPVLSAPAPSDPTAATATPAATVAVREPRAKAPAAPVVVKPPAPLPVDAPRISNALVVLRDASAVRATCGDVNAEGSTTASVRKFPPGSCHVTVTWLGKVLETDVVIDRAREVACSVDGDRLTCR